MNTGDALARTRTQASTPGSQTDEWTPAAPSRPRNPQERDLTDPHSAIPQGTHVGSRLS